MFAGKVVAITGASEGIGAALARQILAATHARERELWLKLAVPEAVDRMVMKTVRTQGEGER